MSLLKTLEINKYQPSSYFGRLIKPRQIKINTEILSLESILNLGIILDFKRGSKVKIPTKSQKIMKADLYLLGSNPIVGLVSIETFTLSVGNSELYCSQLLIGNVKFLGKVIELRESID